MTTRWVRASAEHLGRLDVRETLVQLGALRAHGTPLTSDEWSVVLGIGCGVASLSGERLCDDRATIRGALTDHPSLELRFALECAPGETESGSPSGPENPPPEPEHERYRLVGLEIVESAG